MKLRILKNFRLWSMVVPALLVIFTIGSAVKMFSWRRQGREQVQRAAKVEKEAQRIFILLNRSGRANLDGSALPDFLDKASAGICARAARIPLTRLTRGESQKPKKEKDGRLRHRENYKLRGVRLLQIAQFIDYAERNFSSLSCTQLVITTITGGKAKDSWDATVSLQYLTNE